MLVDMVGSENIEQVGQIGFEATMQEPRNPNIKPTRKRKVAKEKTSSKKERWSGPK
ncbi:hypothetical protein ACE6H2_015613 [Prunus campanulata]